MGQKRGCTGRECQCYHSVCEEPAKMLPPVFLFKYNTLVHISATETRKCCLNESVFSGFWFEVPVSG